MALIVTVSTRHHQTLAEFSTNCSGSYSTTHEAVEATPRLQKLIYRSSYAALAGTLRLRRGNRVVFLPEVGVVSTSIRCRGPHAAPFFFSSARPVFCCCYFICLFCFFAWYESPSITRGSHLVIILNCFILEPQMNPEEVQSV